MGVSSCGTIFSAGTAGHTFAQDLSLFTFHKGLDVSHGFVFAILDIKTLHQTVPTKITL
jgi:hypothetical protein